MASPPLPLKTLYRVALATARHYDANPALKALLPLLLSGGSGGGSSAPLPPHHALAVAHQRAFLAEGCAAPPLPGAECARLFVLPAHSLAEYVRAAYRSDGGVGGGSSSGDAPDLDTAADAPAAAAAAASAAACPAVRLAAGSLAQRELVRLADVAEVVAASPDAASHAHPSRASAGVGARIEGQLSESPSVRPGCLLVEHPAALRPGRSCVLVYDIARDVTGPSGGDEWVLRGYALNRPLPGALSDVAPGVGALAALPVFLGGDAGPDGLSVVHRFPDLPSAVPIEGPPEEGDDDAQQQQQRCGLYVGGDLDAINAKLTGGGARAGDFRVALGHVELPLVRGAGGELSLPEPDRWLVAEGPGVAAMALCAPLDDVLGAPHPPGAAPPPGYAFARFAHQNAAWAHAVRALGAWVEMDDPARGRAVRAWASPLAHAATAHYVAAGLTAADAVAIEADKRAARAR